jgi:hypothetical protein
VKTKKKSREMDEGRKARLAQLRALKENAEKSISDAVSNSQDKEPVVS